MGVCAYCNRQDSCRGAVEVFDECGPARYVPCTVRHNEAELDACHMSLAFQGWPNGLRLRSTLWVPAAGEKSSETENCQSSEKGSKNAQIGRGSFKRPPPTPGALAPGIPSRPLHALFGGDSSQEARFRTSAVDSTNWR